MKDTLPYIKYIAKALMAAAIAGVGGIAVGYVDEPLTNGEFWAAMSAAVTAAGATFGISNGPKPVSGNQPVEPDGY